MAAAPTARRDLILKSAITAADAAGMRTFVGTMHLPGEGRGGVPFRAAVTGERLRIEVAGTEVGEWELTAVRAEPTPHGVCLQVGEERVTLVLAGEDAFLSALTPAVVVDLPPPPSRQRATARHRRKRAVIAAALGLASVTGLVVAAISAPVLVGSALMLGGILLLAGGAFTIIDVRAALRLPAAWRPGHLLALGLGFLALGTTVTLLA